VARRRRRKRQKRNQREPMESAIMSEQEHEFVATTRECEPVATTREQEAVKTIKKYMWISMGRRADPGSVPGFGQSCQGCR